jgi:hypothetical protein
MYDEQTVEKIRGVMAGYTEPVDYSLIRDLFTEEKFLNSFCYMIAINEIDIIGWKEYDTRYPDDVKKINRVIEELDNRTYLNEDVTGGSMDVIIKDVLGIPQKEVSPVQPVNTESKEEPFFILQTYHRPYLRSLLLKAMMERK